MVGIEVEKRTQMTVWTKGVFPLYSLPIPSNSHDLYAMHWMQNF